MRQHGQGPLCDALHQRSAARVIDHDHFTSINEPVARLSIARRSLAASTPLRALARRLKLCGAPWLFLLAGTDLVATVRPCRPTSPAHRQPIRRASEWLSTL